MNLEQKLVRDLGDNEYVAHILSIDELKLEYETVKAPQKMRPVTLLQRVIWF